MKPWILIVALAGAFGAGPVANAAAPDATAPPKSDNFLDTVTNLNIKYSGECVVDIDPQTKQTEKTVYTGDVEFKIDEADLYCDRLEIVEGAEKNKRVLVATANAGRRVVLYLLDQSTMAVGDKFVYHPDARDSMLTGTPFTYRRDASGNFFRWKGDSLSISQREDGSSKIVFGPGQMAPADPAKDALDPFVRKRLDAFIKTVDARAKSQPSPTAAPKSTATPKKATSKRAATPVAERVSPPRVKPARTPAPADAPAPDITTKSSRPSKDREAEIEE